MTPPRRLRHSDTHRRDRANNRVRRTTQVSFATAAVASGALVGFLAHGAVASKHVPTSPSGTATQSTGGTSAGQAAGNTPTPAAGQPTSTTTTQAPAGTPTQSAPATTYAPPTTIYVPPAPTYSPPVVSTGGS